MHISTAQTHNRAFTLLEVLLVVAIIGIMAGIVILAINPGKQLADTRNSQRKVDVNTILNATYQYSLDNNGNLPAGLTSNTCSTTPTDEICATGSSCPGYVDLSPLTLNQKYLVAIPVDPSGASATGTSYRIAKNANNRVTVCAVNAENGQTISVTR
jgi:type IV pilus assembly protein PilA